MIKLFRVILLIIMCMLIPTYMVTYAESIKDYDYYKNLDPHKYEDALKEWCKIKTGTELDIENPQTFNEKVQWLKLYDSIPLKTQLADKYLVRDYIKEKIGEKYLIPILGVYDSFDEIDFDKLPNKFALKCNHGSGWNIIVNDKSKFNKQKAKEKFDNWMNKNYAFIFGLELHYKNIKPKIIAEEYIENKSKLVYDYKFFCFDGKPFHVWVDVNSGRSSHKRNIYDLEGNKLPLKVSYPNFDFNIDKNIIRKMASIAEKLSEGFVLVRVDFYLLNDGTIKVGELTFSPQSGICKFDSPEYNKALGDQIILPKEKHIY